MTETEPSTNMYLSVEIILSSDEAGASLQCPHCGVINHGHILGVRDLLQIV